jgi:xanthine/uracil permease
MEQTRRLTFELDDLPPWPRNLIYGLQWMIIFLPILITLSTLCSEFLGLAGEAKILFFQRVLLTTGVIVILQTLVGHRYPLLDGPSTALLLCFIVLAPQGMAVIQGGMLIGGGVLILIGAFRLLRYIQPLFTSNVIGVTLILIAITLLPYLCPMVIGQSPTQPHGEPVIFGISIFMILLIALFSHWLPGFFRTIPLFVGILIGSLLMGILGYFPLAGIREASWISIPDPLLSTVPTFQISAIATFLIAYLAVLINALGSFYGIGEIVGKKGIDVRVDRGVGFTGLGGFAGGILGSIGTVSFGISPGVVLVTGVGSRFAVTACGLLIVSLVFFQKLLAILSSIPASILAAALITATASQIGTGISILTRDMHALTGRDYLVIGIPILLGGIISMLPRGFFQAFPLSLQALLKNGMVVGIILVLLLEHLLLRSRKGKIL